jgi:hypothetical protein
MRLLLLLFITVLLWFSDTAAQQPVAKVPPVTAVQHIKKLRDGNLLVMLPEDSPMPRPNVSSEKYYSLVKAFSENYKFSKVYFFYRVDARLLRKRDGRVRMFNSKWERVSIDTLAGKDYYISTINFSEEVNLPALAILDSAFQHLPHPFPNPVRIYASVPLLEVPIHTAVYKLDLRLRDFSKSKLDTPPKPRK